MKKKVKKIKKLSRSLGHRKALVRNLVTDLILKGKIKTTLVKAKTIRPVTERLITQAKKTSSASQRVLNGFFYQPKALKKMVEEIGPRFKNRAGGYTRIVKLGPRQLDSVEEAIIELLESNEN